MKIIIIANPAAGKGRAVEKIHALAQILTSKNCDVETYVTSKPGDAQQRLSYVTHDTDCVVATGGDGTLNEIINGLPEPGKIPIAIFPTGTANVLAKELSLPDNPRLSARILLNRKICPVDMGTIGKRRFLLFASAGFDAHVTKEVLHNKSRLTGYERYAVPLLKTFYHYRIPHLNVTLDRDISMKGGLVLISNTKTYGGIFTITDRARCDSRYFDTCILSDGSIPSLIHYFLYALFGKVSQIKKIRFLTAKEIEITSPEPVPVQVDGDYFGTTPVTIQLSSARVPVIVP